MASITLAPSDAAADAVALVVFENQRALPAGYTALDDEVGGLITRTLARTEFQATRGAVLSVYPERPGTWSRVLLVGLGDPKRFTGNELRLGMVKLVQAASAAHIRTLDLRLLDGLADRLPTHQAGHAVADGLSIGSFEFKTFKGAATNPADDASARPTGWDVEVVVEAAMRDAVDAGLRIGRGVSTARRLAATPPNVANPRYIADQCRALADETGMTCDVLEKDRLAELGLGGLAAVGRAGSTPPALIVLEWDGTQGTPAEAGAAAPHAPLLLVGKAITFDTGGYSLKVGGAMAGMKYDKCGGMAVIGAMEAIARLKLPVRVVGLLPCAENLIDQNAFRVDDILTFCNGVTAEITNTDAEGRLVLADALAYGTKTYTPAAVIDLATLTGGVRVALGTHCAGLFCNDDALRARVDAAAEFTGERVWRLPLWDEHREQMKGQHADLVNSADRSAHPIQGAAFLSYFVGEDAPRQMPTLPWAHLDIAATVTTDSEAGGSGAAGLFPKGPTGWGVRLVTHIAQMYAS